VWIGGLRTGRAWRWPVVRWFGGCGMIGEGGGVSRATGRLLLAHGTLFGEHTLAFGTECGAFDWWDGVFGGGPADSRWSLAGAPVVLWSGAYGGTLTLTLSRREGGPEQAPSP